MTAPPTIRPRRPEDVPALATLLAEQQAESDYPMRWPLPYPVERFIVRAEDQRAWVADLDGTVVGHVAAGRAESEYVDAYVAATGTEQLGCLSTLFTGTTARGTGVGGRLHDTAVEWIRGRGAVPVLDVAPGHGRALRLYERRGWREIARVRPGWLLPGRPDVRLMVLDRPRQPAWSSA